MLVVSVYRLGRGVRLQRVQDGAFALLVPEGIVELNESAAETLALVDGERDTAAIAGILGSRHAVDAAEIERDVASLLADFRERGYVNA